MKQKIKNYLKYGIILFGIPIFIVACQKDDLGIQHSIQQQPENPAFKPLKYHLIKFHLISL